MSTRIASIPFLLRYSCSVSHASPRRSMHMEMLTTKSMHSTIGSSTIPNPLLYLKRGELYRLLRHWDSADADYSAEQLEPAERNSSEKKEKKTPAWHRQTQRVGYQYVEREPAFTHHC